MVLVTWRPSNFLILSSPLYQTFRYKKKKKIANYRKIHSCNIESNAEIQSSKIDNSSDTRLITI